MNLRKFLHAPDFPGLKCWVSRGEFAYEIQTTNIQHKMKAIRGEFQSNGVPKLTFFKEADIKIFVIVKV
jgi:hypothetical protein